MADNNFNADKIVINIYIKGGKPGFMTDTQCAGVADFVAKSFGDGFEAGDPAPQVNIPLSYDAISDLEAGDPVLWEGTKFTFTGTLVDDVTDGYDDDQESDVLVVRIERDDTGKTVKLNLAPNHKGTLTLLA